jgi:hypothetical protein
MLAMIRHVLHRCACNCAGRHAYRCAGCCRTRTRAAAVSALAADRGHVRAVAADGLAAFTSRHASFIGSELVSRSLGMRSAPAFACNLSLLRSVHRRETALTRCHA